MHSETIKLPQFKGAVLHCYTIEGSKEYDAGRKRPAMLVLPGGGYKFTSDREAEFIALNYAAKGYHAFTLRYTVEQPLDVPMTEAFASIAYIRENADQWGVDPDKIACIGFSAGGHLASCMAARWNTDATRLTGKEAALCKPNAAILSYPVIVFPLPTQDGQGVLDREHGHWIYDIMMGKTEYTDDELVALSTDKYVSADTAPCFVWITYNDPVVFPVHTQRYVDAMIQHGVPVEYHMFADGKHGLSLANHTTAGRSFMINPAVQPWFELSVTWLDTVLDNRTTYAE